MGFATVEEVKKFFNLEDDSLDEFLEFLVPYYSDVIEDQITGTIPTAKQLKRALFAALGCHLSKTNPGEISQTISYTIGNTKERTQAPASNPKTWCEAYDKEIYKIQKQTTTVVGIQRRGLSDLTKDD